MALQGLLSNSSSELDECRPTDIVVLAIETADILIDRLNKAEDPKLF